MSLIRLHVEFPGNVGVCPTWEKECGSTKALMVKRWSPEQANVPKHGMIDDEHATWSSTDHTLQQSAKFSPLYYSQLLSCNIN